MINPQPQKRTMTKHAAGTTALFIPCVIDEMGATGEGECTGMFFRFTIPGGNLGLMLSLEESKEFVQMLRAIQAKYPGVLE